jgi:hypothetical protein
MGQANSRTYFPPNFLDWMTNVAYAEDTTKARAFVEAHREHVVTIIAAHRKHEADIRARGAKAWMDATRASATGPERERRWRKMREAEGLPIECDDDADDDTRAAFVAERNAAMGTIKCDADPAMDGLLVRALYDMIVAAKVCDTWEALLALPVEDMRQYYESRYPQNRTEEIMREAQAEYGISDSPEPLIEFYKHMCLEQQRTISLLSNVCSLVSSD